MKIKIESTLDEDYIVTFKSMGQYPNRICVRKFDCFADAFTFVSQYMLNHYNS